ncbi:hypothetical protein [Streptomyces avermitilis]|uniref:hypothetical protein n=1 Tax=Streptomyces avermitilis TaxID=33903 RepID=UPI00382E35B1
MKLVHLAAAVLLVPIPFLGMTEPAAAANTHAVTAEGWLTAVDSGHPADGVQKEIDGTALLTHDNPTANFRVQVCAGGETRGVLSVMLRLRDSEKVDTSATLYLYEDSQCNNNDLDGTVRAPNKAISLGGGRSLRMYVKNSEFLSPDFVKANFRITHRVGPDIGRPNAPSNVVASRVPGNSHKIAIQWADNATNETGYEIRNTTINQTGSLAPNTTETTWYQPIVFKECFQVRALGAAGPSDWTPVGPKVECA